MQITGGKYRGRKVNTLKSNDVRPTSSKVRQSIFNMLFANTEESLQGACFLDMFAGSGIMALEALSRGAEKVICIEKSHLTAKILKANLKSFDENYELYCTDALVALDKLAGKKFDLIFSDPPYASGLYPRIAQKVCENELLDNDGWLIFEHNSKFSLSEAIAGTCLFIKKQKTYGSTSISFCCLDNSPKA